MANASVVDLDSDLMSLGRSNFNILNGKLLACLPRYGGLAGNGLYLNGMVNVSASQSAESKMVGLMEGFRCWCL